MSENLKITNGEFKTAVDTLAIREEVSTLISLYIDFSAFPEQAQYILNATSNVMHELAVSKPEVARDVLRNSDQQMKEVLTNAIIPSGTVLDGYDYHKISFLLSIEGLPVGMAAKISGSIRKLIDTYRQSGSIHLLLSFYTLSGLPKELKKEIEQVFPEAASVSISRGGAEDVVDVIKRGGKTLPAPLQISLLDLCRHSKEALYQFFSFNGLHSTARIKLIEIYASPKTIVGLIRQFDNPLNNNKPVMSVLVDNIIKLLDQGNVSKLEVINYFFTADQPPNLRSFESPRLLGAVNRVLIRSIKECETDGSIEGVLAISSIGNLSRSVSSLVEHALIRAIESAAEKGKVDQIHDYLFENREQFNLSPAVITAAEKGLLRAAEAYFSRAHLSMFSLVGVPSTIADQICDMYRAAIDGKAQRTQQTDPSTTIANYLEQLKAGGQLSEGTIRAPKKRRESLAHVPARKAPVTGSRK